MVDDIMCPYCTVFVTLHEESFVLQRDNIEDSVDAARTGSTECRAGD